MKLKKMKILALSLGFTPIIMVPAIIHVITNTINTTNKKNSDILNSNFAPPSYFWSEGTRSSDRAYHLYLDANDFNKLKTELKNNTVKSPNSYGWSIMSFITAKWGNNGILLNNLLRKMNDYDCFSSTFAGSEKHMIPKEHFSSVSFKSSALATKNNAVVYFDMNVDWELFADNYGITSHF